MLLHSHRAACVALLPGFALSTGLCAQEMRPAAPLNTTSTVIAAADVDGSGAADVLLGSHLGVHLVLDPGLTGAGQTILLSNRAFVESRTNTHFADLTGDGRLDVLYRAQGNNGHDIVIVPSLGNGAFAPPIVLGPFGSQFFGFQHGTGDFDGNGLLDLAVLDATTFQMPEIAILMQGPAGSFVKSILRVDIGVVVGDFNGDGFDDLVTGTQHRTIYRGSANGLVLVRTETQVQNTAGRVVDLNGDGYDDIAWHTFGGSPELQLGHPGSVLDPQTTPLSVNGILLRADFADMDFDGTFDFVATAAAASGHGLQMSRWRGGTQFSAMQPLLNVPSTTGHGAFADLDGDGDLDYLTNDGMRYENLAHYGGSCGAPMALTSGRIEPGTTWQLSFLGAPANTIASILVSTQDQATACGTLVDPSYQLGSLPLLVTNATGAASQSIAIPPGFVGGPFYLQAIALDPAGGYQRYGSSLSSSGARAVRVF